MVFGRPARKKSKSHHLNTSCTSFRPISIPLYFPPTATLHQVFHSQAQTTPLLLLILSLQQHYSYIPNYNNPAYISSERSISMADMHLASQTAAHGAPVRRGRLRGLIVHTGGNSSSRREEYDARKGRIGKCSSTF